MSISHDFLQFVQGITLEDWALTNLLQYQCPSQTTYIEFRGIPLVSGRNSRTKMVITKIQPAKKRKAPNLKWQSIVKNVWDNKKPAAKLVAMLMLCPVVRIFIGNISLGTSQERGPHEHPKPATYRHIRTSTSMPWPLEICLVLETPTTAASTQATAT